MATSLTPRILGGNWLKLASSTLFNGPSYQRKSPMHTALMTRYEFETLSVSTPAKHVLVVELHRPQVHNAIDKEMARELNECFSRIEDDRYCRAVVLTGHGPNFCSGLDFVDLHTLLNKIGKTADLPEDDALRHEILLQGNDIGRKAKFIHTLISGFQKSFTALESCPKPIIACIQGACLGSAFAITGASDIRYATENTKFCMNEVDIGQVADMGSLQRIPKSIANHSMFKEYTFSGLPFNAKDAEKMGLISRIFKDKEEMQAAAIELAKLISSKSPVAVQGSKAAYNYSRDHSVYDGMRFMANWNMSQLQSEDLVKGVTSLVNKLKIPPTYSDL